MSILSRDPPILQLFSTSIFTQLGVGASTMFDLLSLTFAVAGHADLFTENICQEVSGSRVHLCTFHEKWGGALRHTGASL